MLIRADARWIPLQDQCVQCVVTSPPYWGLRDYGMPGQLGLEPTPDAYVANLVRVFAEVWRVLKYDGTVWLNLGDSYIAAGGGGESRMIELHGADSVACRGIHTAAGKGQISGATGRFRALPPKNLVGIPWRVAFALQAAGWYLRSDIIWAKPNPMPESVTDRPTKAHEYVFLLTKSERYYYDAEAIAEPVAISQIGRVRDDVIGGASWRERNQHSEGGRYATDAPSGACRPEGDDRASSEDVGGLFREGVSGGMGDRQAGRRIQILERGRYENYTGQATKDYASANAQDPSETKRRVLKAMADPDYQGRNARSVWTIPTQPYPEAHFATFPEELPRRCILAGSKPGELIFDPFIGSGTVGEVAEQLGRCWVGADLAYQQLSSVRTAQRGLRWG